MCILYFYDGNKILSILGSSQILADPLIPYPELRRRASWFKSRSWSILSSSLGVRRRTPSWFKSQILAYPPILSILVHFQILAHPPIPFILVHSKILAHPPIPSILVQTLPLLIIPSPLKAIGLNTKYLILNT